MKEYSLPGTYSQIVPLSQDLEKIFKSVLINTGHVLTDFSREATNPILMPDHSSLVLDLKSEEILNIFNTRNNHFFPTPDHLIRIGLVAELRFYNLLALILKSMWERHLYSQVSVSTDPLEYLEVITNEEYINKYAYSFKVETTGIFRLLEAYDHLAMLHGESQASLDITIREMVLKKYHLIDNQLLDKFTNWKIEENKEKLNQDEEKKEEFDRFKMLFLTNHQTIENLLFDQIIISKEIDNIKTKYYQQFPLKKKFMALLYERDLMKIKIRLKKENPEFTEDELFVRTEEVADEFRKRLSELKTVMSKASYIRKFSGEPMDSAAEASYRNQVRKALREAFLLLHPDMIDKSVAEKLNEQQQNMLKQLWIELMEQKDAFCYDESMVLYYLPDLAEIRRIIEKAKVILNNGDLEIDPEYLIRGDTFAEKIEFLKTENKKLDEYIISLQLRIQELLSDEEFQLYSKILSFQEKTEQHEEDMRNGIESFRTQIATLQKQLKEMFNS